MMRRIAIIAAIGLAPAHAFAGAAPLGSLTRPLTVILIPADGGTEDGTKADFQPVFNAVTKTTGLQFRLRVGQSYNSVVEAMCNGSADIAFFGPVSYVQAHQRGCADLLAVAVGKGCSTHFAGIFVKAALPLKTIKNTQG